MKLLNVNKKASLQDLTNSNNLDKRLSKRSSRKPVNYHLESPKKDVMESTPKTSNETPSIPLSVIDTEIEPINITPTFNVIDDLANESLDKPKVNHKQYEVPLTPPSSDLLSNANIPQSINQHLQPSQPQQQPPIRQQKSLPRLPSSTPPAIPAPSSSVPLDDQDFGPPKIDHTKDEFKKRQRQQNRKVTPTSVLSSPLESQFQNQQPLPTMLNSNTQPIYPQPYYQQPSTKSNYLEPPRLTSVRPPNSSTLATQTPLASLYLVSGLPKDPAAWVYADEESISSVHHSPNAVGRWWRAETLGTSASPGIIIPGVDSNGKKKRVGGMPKNEVNKVLAKALKLSFTQEVEIISSSLQPPSTMHSFSFSVSTQNPNNAYASHSINSQHTSSFKSGWNNTTSSNGSSNQKKYDSSNNYSYRPPDVLGLSDVQPGVDKDGRKTYYGVTLQVWSHADPTRAQAIRKALSTHPRRSESVSVASTTKREKIMQKRFGTGNVSGNGGADEASRILASSIASETEDFDTINDTETIGGTTDVFSDVNDAIPTGLNAGLAYEEAPLSGIVPEETLFWLPYCLTLVSTHPIYDIMADYLSISWAIFSRDISSHSAQMKRLLETPAPKHGDLIRLPAAGPTQKHRRYTEDNNKESKKKKEKKKKSESLTIIARMPGSINFGQNLVETNFSMWPFFKALSIENILTICEIALAPTGRILFLSRHPQMLGVACLTLQYLVESRGWSGQCHQIVHARDYSIILEDPGQSIIGARTEVRYSLKPPPEVCVVDLDINFVQCINPPPGYISSGSSREKLKKKLISSFGTFRPDESVPSEFKEAFPSGRFMPMCHIDAKGKLGNTIERVQAPYWWDPQNILGAFDSVLAARTKRPSLIQKLTRSDKRMPGLTQSELKTQQAIRHRAAQFVDSRDELETKIGRLNKRLGFLVSKSEQWKNRFEQFESYAERLSAEAAELRTKIEKERKESKRLSGMVIQQTKARDSLVEQLRQTEFLRAGALAELDVMQTQLRKLENEREDMVSHIHTHLSDALIQLDTVGAKSSSRSNSPWMMNGNTNERRISHKKSSSLESTILEEDYVEKLSNEDDHRPYSPNEDEQFMRPISIDGSAYDLENSKSNHEVQKTMTVIQSKLEKALSDLEASRRHSTDSNEPIHEDIKKTETIQKDIRNIQRSQQFIRQSQLLQLAKDQEIKLANLNINNQGNNNNQQQQQQQPIQQSLSQELKEDEQPSLKYARNSKRRSIHAPARLSQPPKNYHEFDNDEQREFLFDSKQELYKQHKLLKNEYRKSLIRNSMINNNNNNNNNNNVNKKRASSINSGDEQYLSSVESPDGLDDQPPLHPKKDSEEEQTFNRSQALAYLEGSVNKN